jgi:hypothetical protein
MTNITKQDWETTRNNLGTQLLWLEQRGLVADHAALSIAFDFVEKQIEAIEKKVELDLIQALAEVFMYAKNQSAMENEEFETANDLHWERISMFVQYNQETCNLPKHECGKVMLTTPNIKFWVEKFKTTFNIA